MMHGNATTRPKEQIMETFETLYTTRAMRRMKPDSIPLDVQAKILDAAIRAPSSSNQQHWRFIFIDDQGLKEQLAKLYLDAWETYTAPSRQSGQEMSKVRSSADHLARHFAETPLLLIGLTRGEGASSIYPALWSAMLAARTQGVGSTITTMLNRHHDRVLELLGAPADENWKMYACVTMGYPTGRWGIAKRAPATEVAARNAWNGGFGREINEPLWRPGQDG